MWFVVVSDEQGIMQEEVSVAHFKILSWHIPGRTEE
jgi:hypothetical protein